MWGDDRGYTTPEGFELHKPLLMPDARDFADVLTFVRTWDHRTMTHTSGVIPSPELVPDPVIIDGNEIGPFCSVTGPGGKRWSLAVTPTPATVEAIAGQLVTDDDRLSFQVIYHPNRDRCLIILEHGQIIGSRYLAYVDPATVPGFEVNPEAANQ